jgi:hypothetical protein
LSRPALDKSLPVYVDEYEKLVNESIIDGVNADNKEGPTAMKASQELVD